jgi:nucleoside diphosphate kinase
MNPPDYLRDKARILRDAANNPRKDYSEEIRGNMIYAATQLNVAADELQNEFNEE